MPQVSENIIVIQEDVDIVVKPSIMCSTLVSSDVVIQTRLNQFNKP